MVYRLAAAHSTATVIADTIHSGNRITTLELYYPRFILAEVNTHGLLAKSTQSSRAIPIKRRIEELRKFGPYMPDFHGNEISNQAGMQASSEPLKDPEEAVRIWLKSCDDAISAAEALDALKSHKQFANRLLEAFVYTKTVVTATEWDNFYNLRIAPEAQPEFRDLASKMRRVIESSTPKVAWCHLPYVNDIEVETIITASPNAVTLANRDLIASSIMVSAARCARVSYFSFTSGKISATEEDLKLASDLLNSGHLSPFDHPAVQSDEPLTSRFKGWAAIRNSPILQDYK